MEGGNQLPARVWNSSYSVQSGQTDLDPGSSFQAQYSFELSSAYQRTEVGVYKGETGSVFDVCFFLGVGGGF